MQWIRSVRDSDFVRSVELVNEGEIREGRTDGLLRPETKGIVSVMVLHNTIAYIIGPPNPRKLWVYSEWRSQRNTA